MRLCAIEKYKKWIAKIQDDKTKYRCVLCGETRYLSNIGAGALDSHAKGAKHKNKTKTLFHIEAEIKPLTSYWAHKSEPAP
jgi:hypothetical protein